MGAHAGPLLPGRVELSAGPAPLTSLRPDPPPPPLAELGSDQRWWQLQQLRRGAESAQPWLQALADGALAPEPDWLAALLGQLEAAQVEQLLSLLAQQSEPLLAALRQELPAAAPALQPQWLGPLRRHCQELPAPQRPAWLVVLGLWRDPGVAELLRQAAAGEPSVEPQLLVLLGHQRQAADAALLQRRVLEPAPLALRQAALEGLAVGLSAWPRLPLRQTLVALAGDLQPSLAAKAVDLLARLPGGQAELRRLRRRRLDPAVAERLQRRLQRRPLVLIVHGRRGGLIPPELQRLAEELAQRRGVPVLLQALTAQPPAADERFWQAARRAEGFALVPLLLLPGGHVRSDVPQLERQWRQLAQQAAGPLPQRLPFLGAWPAWQRQLAGSFGPAEPGQQRIWLHHPLQGALPQRYLDHLRSRLGGPGLATPYTAQLEDLGPLAQAPTALLPLTLAANRLTEALAAGLAQTQGQVPGPLRLCPPLLQQPAVRQFLLSALEALP